MLGALLRMSGPPTRDAVQDLILSWLVLGDENGHEYGEPQKIGSKLLELFILFEDEDEEEAEKSPRLISGTELYQTMFKAWCAGYNPRAIRELKRRGSDYDHVSEDWVRERDICDIGWTAAFDISTAVFPVSLAKEVARAMGENAIADALARWTYHDKMDAERAAC